MQPRNTDAVSRARNCLAALADRASSVETSSACERVLIELDRIHGDDVRALDTQGRHGDQAALLAETVTALEELVGNGADELRIELLLVVLLDARREDVP